MSEERKNTFVACINCKNIKKRCNNSNDNKTPCERCLILNNLKCIYPTHEKRGRKKKNESINNNNLDFLSKNDISTISKKLKTDINQTKIEETDLREIEEKDISENLKTDTNRTEIEETDLREIKEIDKNEISYLSDKYDLHENAVKSLMETYPDKSLMTILSATSDKPYSDEDRFALLYANI
ncbi:hypothetical protein Glove_384g32 [Diversispora epigaea]|uniref:Zn(2)-C6 fungal-type domain-containing protein n=1 Tax=Diversispora epigaea TaxID=1348612 RepID=A0A397H3Z0_9GLOM|nr:hypothetical protein Glove_384g32 [Diversispora epigaea]